MCAKIWDEMITGNNEESSIKRVEKKLYGNRPVSPKERAELSPLSYDVNGAWEGTEDIATMKKTKDIQTPILRTLLIFAAIFFLSAVGISVYFFVGGSNVISTDNIDLSITGPVSVKGGEEFTLQVVIGNKNSVPLNYSQLIIEYPPGSKVPKSDSTVSNIYTKDLGVVPQSGIVNETAKSVLYGEENSEQDINVTLEYRTEGSNATFIKKKSYRTFISSSPLSLSLGLPQDTNSGKDMGIDLKVDSNSSGVLKDVVLEVAYPSGFIFKSATPAPAYGDNIWLLGDLSAKGGRTIKLNGLLRGQDGEVKTFRASAGTRNSPDDNRVTVVYGSSLQSLVVKKPFISINVALNGNASIDDFIANSGDTIRGDISWTNNLPVRVLNSQVSVKIDGKLVNKTSVSPGSGFFQSGAGVITWDRLNGNFPQSIEPGQTGSQSFSFSFLPLITGRNSAAQNPWLTLEATFQGTRFAEGTEAGSLVESTVTRKVKLSSDLQLSARAVYYAGPFKNMGPLPPERDKETTYTIIWSVTNSSNDVNGVVVKATLPSYVRWIKSISPPDANIVYNPLGGEIVWNVGDIAAGGGVTSEPKEVAFQVAFTPSISQINQYPVVISDTSIFGNDQFTGVETRSVRHSLSTQLVSDSGLRAGEDGPVR